MIHLPTARRKKAAAERAVEYVIVNQGVTYRQAAAIFGVSVNQIRRRIQYRYGSLTEARLHSDTRIRLWDRPCMTCGSKDLRPYGTFRCDQCKQREATLHDGVV